jgi:hypothetical protein
MTRSFIRTPGEQTVTRVGPNASSTIAVTVLTNDPLTREGVLASLTADQSIKAGAWSASALPDVLVVLVPEVTDRTIRLVEDTVTSTSRLVLVT